MLYSQHYNTFLQFHKISTFSQNGGRNCGRNKMSRFFLNLSCWIYNTNGINETKKASPFVNAIGHAAGMNKFPWLIAFMRSKHGNHYPNSWCRCGLGWYIAHPQHPAWPFQHLRSHSASLPSPYISRLCVKLCICVFT